MDLFTGWRFTSFFAASAFVFVTTADDTVWLIPVIASEKHSIQHRFIHCLVFVCTLQFACLSSWLVCVIFGNALESAKIHSLGGVSLSFALQVTGAALCWFIAIALFIQKQIKMYRRRQGPPRLSAEVKDVEGGEHSALLKPSTNYSTAPLPSPAPALESQVSQESTLRLGFVFSMTIAGALDEMMCFPALMLGKTFSVWELSAGCLAASLLLLLILLTLYSAFKPLFDVFDRIPLYAVVTMFAIIQTVDIASEMGHKD
ncbi:hypothetical protein B484DRAFT_454469 [Ochromonadaceae sp. CCMP2298]|nr:hypothetical protein B484DRAFT_454469 [Ochromonadaceae sp. CCMP2298]|eukprot:CAMPEP_0173171316 /NCGR_PEP_ID=MMETSP1141-20130122/1699_1 /TAXON_ID=483371 /ORGANISM="non described non described, Strain CCMP2298" /LENGTH=258 /DNA_ID=CAMNT_0014093255 /DNA_START=488 /DNA_END=1264 /DNA_ORIENTATION=-